MTFAEMRKSPILYTYVAGYCEARFRNPELGTWMVENSSPASLGMGTYESKRDAWDDGRRIADFQNTLYPVGAKLIRYRRSRQPFARPCPTL